VREVCTEVRVKTCQPQSVTDCDWKWQVPSQEFTHKRRCYGHNEDTGDVLPKAGQEEVGATIQLRGNDDFDGLDRNQVWSK